MSKILHVTHETFEAEVLQSQLPVLVDFYADWCPPCRALGPILDRLAQEFEGRIKFVKINSDQEPALARHFNVSGLPTIAFIKDGKTAGQFAGLPEEAALRAELATWLESQTVQTR